MRFRSERVSPARLREVLSFDPESGDMRWLITRAKARIGALAGCSGHLGYRTICIDGQRLKAHRIMWALVHSEWPREDIDHLNGDPGDNRISNLREAPGAMNNENIRGPTKNNASGFLGVHRHGKKFGASIFVNGVSRWIGMYETPEFAYGAYLAKKRELHKGCTL